MHQLMRQRQGNTTGKHDGIEILIVNRLPEMAADVVLTHHYANQGFVKNNAHNVSALLFNIFTVFAHPA
jgi:hypothetical protein